MSPPQVVHSRRGGPHSAPSSSGPVLLDITLQVEELLLAMRISAKLTVLNATVDLPVSFRAAGADVQVHLEFQNKARCVRGVFETWAKSIITERARFWAGRVLGVGGGANERVLLRCTKPCRGACSVLSAAAAARHPHCQAPFSSFLSPHTLSHSHYVSARSCPSNSSHGQAPYVTEVKVSLLDLPRIDVSIRPGALGAPRIHG